MEVDAENVEVDRMPVTSTVKKLKLSTPVPDI